MGSLFVVVVPVRSYEFQLRLVENKLATTPYVQTDSYIDLALIPLKALEPDDVLQEKNIQRAQEIVLPQTKDELKKYTLLKDGEKLFLEVTRDTMKLEEWEKKRERRASLRRESSGNLLELENRSNDRRESLVVIQDRELIELINSHFLEKHVEDALTKFGLLNASWEHSIDSKFSQISFTVNAEKAETLISHFHTAGVGKKYDSTLSVCTATVFSHEDGKKDDDSESDDEEDKAMKEKMKGKWNSFVQSIKARLTVAQVVSNVKANTVITFDFLVMVLVAGVIASLGLLENSSVNLVASMLISPLMGPIMGFTFGFIIRDWGLVKLGLISELVGLSMCLVVGLLVGVFAELRPINGPWADIQEWPTAEMSGRSQLRALVVGAGIAIPSGAGVALSILAGNAGSLVGVAISASLLPPCVNCGVFYGLALVIAVYERVHGRSSIGIPCGDALLVGEPDHQKVDHWRNHTQIYCKNALKEFAIMGTVSLCLTLLNIVLIFITSIIVLKIKEVAPYTTKTSFERFWKHDVKEARDYNKSHTRRGTEALLAEIDDQNVPKILHAVEDDFVFNQIKNRVMYRDENILSQVKEKHSRAAVSQAPQPAQSVAGTSPGATGGLLGWFSKPPAHES